MGKKKGNKKGKLGDDSDFELEFSEQPQQDQPAAPADSVDTNDFNKDEEGEDLGGLMSTIAKASNSKKKKAGKKNKKAAFDDDDQEDAAAILAAMDAAEGQDDDFNVPLGMAKGNNKKKNKKKQPVSMFDALATDDIGDLPPEEDEEDEPAPAPAPVVEKPVNNASQKKKNNKKKAKGGPAASAADEEDLDALLAELGVNEATPAAPIPSVEEKVVSTPPPEEEVGEIRIKSKKEKERERKERQKQAKKEQAAKQKQTPSQKGSQEIAESSRSTPEPVESAAAAVTSAAIDDNDDDEEGGDSKDKKKKKKKKGAAAVKEEPKRKGPPVAALREMMLARKAAEEEARRREEEDRKKLEEEQKRIEEEERLKQEAKEKKKEKERLKKLELKKQGKYLTPAQKAAQAQARARTEALLASGAIRVAALEEGSKTTKRPVYNNRKKKNDKNIVKDSSTPTSAPSASPAPSVTKDDEDEVKESWEDLAASDKEEKEPVKESWEDESPEEEEDGIKDSWDDSSDEEKEEQQVAQKKTEPAKKGAVASKVTATANKAKAGEQKKDEESEEESDEEESEDEDETDDSDEEEDSDDDSDYDSDEDLTAAQRQAQKKKEEAAQRRKERMEAALAARSKDNLRSPICVILGHVDTGKTKLLDKIRQTNVQEGEAGGITQQIGATFFPMEAILQKTAAIHKDGAPDYRVPGLLVIDTPGHESFTNLRSRGSSLCNIAVLVVDIVHGLEPQTIESLNLLRQRKTPFIVALNKIDRMFDWQAHPNMPTRDTLALQKPHVIKEFESRVQKTIVEFAEQGLNACLYWDNKNMGRNVSLVPTSAITGEGVPDLLHLLIDLTQTRMTENLMYLSELECTVLEVKVIEGLGTTIDVVLSNGVLHEGDRICVCGLNGPIVTQVRALLTPQPMRELRVKSAYVHHKSVKAALGIKISAPDLEKAIAGSRLMVIGPDDDEDDIKEEVMGDLTSLLSSIDKSGKGVCVQASTLGSLEALLTFLKASNIPVSGINIGPVHKKDVIRASVMIERAREYAQLLAFDVPVDKDAADLAEEFGVKIFTANIIYHLFDQFTAYMKELEEQKRKDAAPVAVFPCLLKIVPGAVFNKRSPIIVGVDVMEGVLKVGTPLCVVNKENGSVINLGKVTGIELNHKARQEVKRGDPSVAVRIESATYETPKLYGRHFTEENEIYSHISRTSIDILKTTFRNDLSRDDWALVVKLKKLLKID